MIRLIISQYRWLLITASLFSTLSAVAGILLISYVNQEVSNLGNTNDIITNRIIAFSAGLAAMVFLGILSQTLLAKLSTSVVSKLRSSIILRILGTDYEQIETIGGHRLHATVTTDVGSIANSLTVFPTMLFNLTTVLLCLIYLAYLSLAHFGLLLATLILMIVGAYILMSYARRYFRLLREQEDALFQSFKTLIDGGKELNLNNHRKNWFYTNIVEPSIKNIKNTEFTAQFFWSINNNWTNFIVFGLMGLVIYAFNLVLPATKEMIVGYILVIIYFVGPLSFVISAMQPIIRGTVAYRKLQSLQLANDDVYNLQRATEQSNVHPKQKWNQISIQALEYSYSSANIDEIERAYVFSIGPIDMTIQQGELLFLTGGNGSGKSTFAKLLTGLYTPTKGVIKIDGQEVKNKSRNEYRHYFSTIFSDFYLFEQVLNKEGRLADDKIVNQFIKKLQLQNKVTTNNGILSTVNLSQGQRKRLALLLVYLEDSPIFLFDEWAADQDPYFRKYFYTELLADLKQQGKTVIVITHDDRYFDVADRLLKFDDGLVMELAPETFRQLASQTLQQPKNPATELET